MSYLYLKCKHGVINNLRRPRTMGCTSTYGWGSRLLNAARLPVRPEAADTGQGVPRWPPPTSRDVG